MSSIVNFPLTTEARFRKRLSRCHNLRVLDRWAKDIRKARHAGRLTHDEFVGLVAR